MPRLKIQHNAGEQFRVGAELDWEFSINGFDACESGWEISGDGLRWNRLDVGEGMLIVPEGAQDCFVRAYLRVLELDRNGTRILCTYHSDAWGPVGDPA